MAEFAASLIALMGVSLTAAEVSVRLIRLSRDFKYAEKDINNFASAISLFGRQIEIAHIRLMPECKKPNPSSIFEFLVKRNVMRDLQGQSDDIKECIHRVKPKILSLPNSSKLVARLKWIFLEKDDMRDIVPQMESLKQSLIFIMQLVTMDAVLRGVQTEETMKLM
jgi:hypothetical protein